MRIASCATTTAAASAGIAIKRTSDQPPQTRHNPRPNKRHQRNLAMNPRLKANSGPGRHIQPQTASCRAIKIKRSVGLGKVKVRANLHRPVASVHHGQNRHGAASVQLQGLRSNYVLTGNH